MAAVAQRRRRAAEARGDLSNGRGARLLFLFLDGVGLGGEDAAANPFMAARTPVLEHLLGGKLSASLEARTEPGRVFRALDAALGVAGLPQSATGQAALLTGRNAAQHMGRHYGPWPGPTLQRLLDEGTIFSEVVARGGRARLANVYPPGYFEARARGRRRANVPVYAAQAAALPLLTLDDYQRGQGVSVDLTGDYLAGLLPELPGWTPQVQGERLARLAAVLELTFFDFWPTDDAGHRSSFAEAVALVERLDAFLAGVLAGLGETTLLLVSDHGNLEDKRSRTHTTARVPLLVLGPGSSHFAGARSLLDVAPGVRRVLAATEARRG